MLVVVTDVSTPLAVVIFRVKWRVTVRFTVIYVCQVHRYLCVSGSCVISKWLFVQEVYVFVGVWALAVYFCR